MAKPIIWTEPLPDCDFCGGPGTYDGKTKMGPWANMCDTDLKQHGYPASDELTFQRVPRNPLEG